jgi:hypothetical protein
LLKAKVFRRRLSRIATPFLRDTIGMSAETKCLCGKLTAELDQLLIVAAPR